MKYEIRSGRKTIEIDTARRHYVRALNREEYEAILRTLTLEYDFDIVNKRHIGFLVIELSNGKDIIEVIPAYA